jgi:NADH-quinone oxidoreductase subunit F
VEVRPEGFFYEKVKPEDAPEIVAQSLIEGRLVPHLVADPDAPRAADLPFFKPQIRLLMARLGETDPEDIDDYLLTGGYEALGRALSGLPPAAVSALVEQSGLRGRGGGGFPSGLKWRACRLAPGEVKYVVANGDEGDPGAFMNRSLMEGDPLAIIEGLTLGGYAVGAARGFIYVRHEYPLSVERLGRALDAARALGLLGEDILGSGFNFDLEIIEGGGAFVCGESTALMASIEGREGVPRVKYVRSTERGLWECPTLLSNVETWATIPHLVNRGPEWFKSLGAPGNPGTKMFALVGQVRRTGLAEMPLGSKLRTFVEDVGGGVRPGRLFKAVQSGGPSGGCLPAAALDLPVDFDHLTLAGAMMGSGGLIVMDDLSCLVDVARYFTRFLMDESCGKCVPCREGLSYLVKILDDMCQGRGRAGDVERLEEMARELAATALCGLGQSAANPILSTLRYFREEYLEHAGEGYCRSGRCSGMYLPAINAEACTGCGACLTACPAGAIEGEKKKPHQLRPEKCQTCGACLSACRFRAVTAERRPAHV